MQELFQLSVAEVETLLRDKAREYHRTYGEMLQVLAHLEQRGETSGLHGMRRVFADVTRSGVAASRLAAKRALALHGSTGLTGRIPSNLSYTEQALRSGEIGVEHADKIRGLWEKLPVDVNLDAWAIAEHHLVDMAKEVGPRGLTFAINEFRARLDPDGQEPSEKELAEPEREARTQWVGERFRLAAEMDKETGMVLEAAIRALAKPRGKDGDGRPDPRDLAQRQGDALADLIRLASTSTSSDMPKAGGEPFTLLLTVGLKELQDGIGAATTMDGRQVPISQVRRIACDCGIIPVLMGSHSEPLDLGSRVRTASPSVRRWLVIRDGGCAHPDCDVPPQFTQAHHITLHSKGGYTNPDTMCLLCPHHHRLVHHSDWEISMQDGKVTFHRPHYRGGGTLQPATLAA